VILKGLNLFIASDWNDHRIHKEIINVTSPMVHFNELYSLNKLLKIFNMQIGNKSFVGNAEI